MTDVILFYKIDLFQSATRPWSRRPRGCRGSSTPESGRSGPGRDKTPQLVNPIDPVKAAMSVLLIESMGKY